MSFRFPNTMEANTFSLSSLLPPLSPDATHHVVLILDVDGVTRSCVGSAVDRRVTRRVSRLITTLGRDNIRVNFLSGSPLLSDLGRPEWCRGNLGLCTAFSGCFPEEWLNSGVVSIYGQFGTERLVSSAGDVEILAQFSDAQVAKITKALLSLYLTTAVKERGQTQLEKWLDVLVRADDVSTPLIADIANDIRTTYDRGFRLLTSHSVVETHEEQHITDTVLSPGKLHTMLDGVLPPTASCCAGIAHRKGAEFRYLSCSYTNKGTSANSIVAKCKGALCPDPAVITAGDGCLDYSMHKLAHVSFHVGPASVFEMQQGSFPHVALVDGGGTHCDGTVKVLDFLLYSLTEITFDDEMEVDK